MSDLATTKMTSKGQIVIPEDIRRELKLKIGSQFIVVGNKDVVILKNVTPPTIDEFSDLISDLRLKARKLGIKKTDISKAIDKVRGKKK
jgi:AbrB family looped-hinge helix DNA binding protein